MSRSQRVKKFMRFDSLGLVDFAIGLVDSVLNLPGGQVNFFLVEGAGGGGGGGGANWRRENGRENGKGTDISFCHKSHEKV